MAQWLHRQKSWLTIALAASLAFNVGFVASALLRREPVTQAEVLPAAVDGRPLTELLEMTPEQLERMHQERQALIEQLTPLEAEQASLQREMGALIDVDQPDQAAIAKNLDELNAVQREIQEQVIGHHMELRTFLTAEQCRKFAELIQPPEPRGRHRRFDGQGPRGPGGGGGGGRGRGLRNGPPEDAGRMPYRGAPGIGGEQGLQGNPPPPTD